MSDFPHAMLREIFEQPEAIRRTLDLYVSGHALRLDAFAAMAEMRANALLVATSQLFVINANQILREPTISNKRTKFIPFLCAAGSFVATACQSRNQHPAPATHSSH